MATAKDNGNEPAQSRISFTVTPDLRRKIRIAAAHADMENGEWIQLILERAAEKAAPTR